MSWLISAAKDPTVWLIVVGQLIVAWSLWVSHHGHDPIIRRITKTVAVPMIISGIFLGLYKSKVDSINQEHQAEILGDLQTKEAVLSGGLESQINILHDLQQDETTLHKSLKGLAASYDSQTANMAGLQLKTATLGDNLAKLLIGSDILAESANQTASDLKKLIAIANKSIAIANQNSAEIRDQLQQAEDEQAEKDRQEQARRQREESDREDQHDELVRQLRDIKNQGMNRQSSDSYVPHFTNLPTLPTWRTHARARPLMWG